MKNYISKAIVMMANLYSIVTSICVIVKACTMAFTTDADIRNTTVLLAVAFVVSCFDMKIFKSKCADENDEFVLELIAFLPLLALIIYIIMYVIRVYF